MKNTTDILICGVGGQGILLASEILSDVSMQAGYDVKKSEVHGMAQRGGNVQSHVRFGEKVYSPLIKKGEADFILSFEKMEAMRYLEYLTKKGCVIVNTQQIVPITVTTTGIKYPENPIEFISQYADELVSVDGMKLAKELGSAKVVNVLLLGVLARRLNIDKDIWENGIISRFKAKNLPEKIIDVNIKAFNRGYNL